MYYPKDFEDQGFMAFLQELNEPQVRNTVRYSLLNYSKNSPVANDSKKMLGNPKSVIAVATVILNAARISRMRDLLQYSFTIRGEGYMHKKRIRESTIPDKKYLMPKSIKRALYKVMKPLIDENLEPHSFEARLDSKKHLITASTTPILTCSTKQKQLV